MEVLKTFLSYIGLYESKINFIEELPLEISSMIIAMLDWKSLQSAAMVNGKWRHICEYEQRRRKLLQKCIMPSKCTLSIKLRKRIFFESLRKTNKSIIIDCTKRSEERRVGKECRYR